MKIGIFGGSFNPPHKMHKSIAKKLIKNKYLDKVIYVPTGNKYNKKDLIDFKHRYNMLKILVDNNSNLKVSNYEQKNKLIYTYETINYFKDKYKNDEIYFICGSDNLKQIENWKKYNYILNNFKILVIKRNNDNIKKILTNINTSNIIIANIELNNISSTNIRNILTTNYKKAELNTLIEEKILEYIEKNKLYNKGDKVYEKSS